MISERPFYSSPQHRTLARNWPYLFAALEQTYFPSPLWTQTIVRGQNYAGYFVKSTILMQETAAACFPGSPPPREVLDLAAAREIRYLYGRGHQFRNVPAALTRCLCNLIRERPERIMEAWKRWEKAPSAAVPPSPPTSSAPATATPLLCPGSKNPNSGPKQIGFVLQELTRPRTGPPAPPPVRLPPKPLI